MSDLTRATRAAYLAAGGVKCPFCGSADISGGFVNIDADGASQRVECQSCGRHWFDLYRLSDVLTDREVDEQSASLIAMASTGAEEPPEPSTVSNSAPIAAQAANCDILIVVSGGIVQSVYAPDRLQLQVIDFDNLKEGDVFEPDGAYPAAGPVDCPEAVDKVAEAVRMSESNRALHHAEDAHDHV